MWKILQQKEAEDFVIATGYLNELSEFIKNAFSSVNLNWENHVTSNQIYIDLQRLDQFMAAP